MACCSAMSASTPVPATPAPVATPQGGGALPSAPQRGDSNATGAVVAALQQVVQAVQQLVAALQGGGAGAGGGGAAGAAGAVASAAAPTASAPVAVPAPTVPTTTPVPSVVAGSGRAPVGSAREGVLLIGDSLSVGTKQYLTSGLAGQPVEVDATGGIPLKEGMRRYDARADKPRVVEMALFTNNDPSQVGELRSAIQRTVDDARARGGKVVWATIVRPGDFGPVNDVIRQMAAQNADVMGLVDWQRMVAEHPSYLAGDQIHGTAEGYQARAQAFADAAR